MNRRETIRILRSPSNALRSQRRVGAAAVEFCLVASVLFLLILGIMGGALAVFRTHQVTAIATEATRWAAVRGPEYERLLGMSPITEDDVREAILNKLSGLHENRLGVTVSWTEDGREVSAEVTYEVFNGWRVSGSSRQPVVF